MKYEKNTIRTSVFTALIANFTCYADSTLASSVIPEKGQPELLYSIPLIDRCGIVAVLEGKLECPNLEAYKESLTIHDRQPGYECQSVVEISTPNWSKSAVRYCPPGSEFSIFDTIGALSSPLKIRSHTRKTATGDIQAIEMTSEILSEEYELPVSQLPALPKHANNSDIRDLIIALHPRMLEYYDDETSTLTSWQHKMSISNQFTNEVMKVMEEKSEYSDRRFVTLTTRTHYAISLELNEDNRPAAVFLDDMQGAWIRNFLKHSAPARVAGNTAEFATHIWKTVEYACQLSSSKAILSPNTGKLVHNGLELAEHGYHLLVDAHNAWPFDTSINPASEQVKPGQLTSLPFSLYDYMPVLPGWLFAFGLGTLEAANLGWSAYELYSERHDGKLKVLRNLIGPIMVLINIASDFADYKPHKRRIEEMKNMKYKDDFKKYHGKYL